MKLSLPRVPKTDLFLVCMPFSQLLETTNLYRPPGNSLKITPDQSAESMLSRVQMGKEKRTTTSVHNDESIEYVFGVF